MKYLKRFWDSLKTGTLVSSASPMNRLFSQMALTWTLQNFQPRITTVPNCPTTLNFADANFDPTLSKKAVLLTINTIRILASFTLVSDWGGSNVFCSFYETNKSLIWFYPALVFSTSMAHVFVCSEGQGRLQICNFPFLQQKFFSVLDSS